MLTGEKNYKYVQPIQTHEVGITDDRYMEEIWELVQYEFGVNVQGC